MKLSDVDFIKCEEYNPLHEKANSLGMRSFWKAVFCGETIATLCNTKKECVQEVREYIRRHKN